MSYLLGFIYCTGILNVNKTLKQWEKRQWRPDFGHTNKWSYEQPLGPHYVRKLGTFCTSVWGGLPVLPRHDILLDAGCRVS